LDSLRFSSAYGSGCDIVILASDFECVQIIPGAQNGNIQVGCVECSQQLGRIAASYGNTVCIFEPIASNPNKRHKQLNYQWQKTGQFFLNAITYNLAWDPQGNRILAATERLQLWAPPTSDTLIEEEDSQLNDDRAHELILNDWKCVWQCKTAAAVHITQWSPDGEYFATAGKDDCLLKVWYPSTGWKSAVVMPDVTDKKISAVHFSFVYLAHPRMVTGFSWRKTSKYMPKGSVCNVLLTSCADGICRLWSETLLPEDSLLGGQISENSTSFSSSLPNIAQKDKIQHALESIHHLKHLRRGRRRSSALVAHTELLPSQLGSHETHRHISHHANALCHFHISASINPNTGCYLRPHKCFFFVSYLMHKAFMALVNYIMSQTREEARCSPYQPLDELSDKGSSEHEEGDQEGSTKASSPGSSSSLPLPSVLLDRKLDALILEWNKSPDMLFTIHPHDGSFLVWHVKYLDEFIPGVEPQIEGDYQWSCIVCYRCKQSSAALMNAALGQNTFFCSERRLFLNCFLLAVSVLRAVYAPWAPCVLAACCTSRFCRSALSTCSWGKKSNSEQKSARRHSHFFPIAQSNEWRGGPSVVLTKVYSCLLWLIMWVIKILGVLSKGHLSSSSIYPVCLAPYLIVTTCSDGRVRFWHCRVDMELSAPHPKETRSYRWEQWSLLKEEDDIDSSVCVAGRPVAVSCSYTGRLAVSFKQMSLENEGGTPQDFSMLVSIYECESTGGSEWVLEQTIHLDDFSKPGKTLDPRVSVDSNLVVYSKSDLFVTKDSPNIKHFVHLDWLSKEDGSHILTVGVGSNILMYGRISGVVTEQTGVKDGMAVTLPLGGSIKQGIRSRWVLLRSVNLVSSVDGTPSLPVSLSWVRDGILVVGMDCEMQVYAQWRQDEKPGDSDNNSISSPEGVGGRTVSVSNEGRARSKSVFEGSAGIDDVFRPPAVIQDGGLFEAAHSLSPTLPQYHPTQLLELMDLGRVRRAKAILAHLVKCIAGEVAVVRDVEAGEGGARRHLSRTISVTGSTAKDIIVAGRDVGRDYTEINSIPPLPLYALLSADQDTSYKMGEEAGKGADRDTQKQPEDQYSDLFQVQTVTTDDFVSFAAEKPEKKSRVINLSQYGPTYFGPEHAQVLSSHLMHSSLPGLTRLEQMFLVALADTVATTSAEVAGPTDKQYAGGEALDECGLRYLLAMRLHTCLLTSLPPLYRMQLLHQGVSTCHFAWAFHSEAEEEMLNMIPAMQRGDPQWSELRAVGAGWWVRNINTLRRMVEKVAKAAFQRHNDPLDAALFYLAMKKKAVLWGLFRSQHDEKMTQFFSHNFSEDRWRKAALKNAFSLLGKQRFEQSAAFFLLAGSLKDAIEVCTFNAKLLKHNFYSNPLNQICFSDQIILKRAPVMEVVFVCSPQATVKTADSPGMCPPRPSLSLSLSLFLSLSRALSLSHTRARAYFEGKVAAGQLEKWGDDGSLDLEDSQIRGEAGAYERHQMERRRLQAKQLHAERRKAWLRENQALLRVFLSYCSLHGAKGGGVTSVRMELLFLLQESQQEMTVKQLQSPLPLPTTLPLLSASIAPTKTVIANPVLHLRNHIHDVLYTIVQMEAPPHPNILDDRVNALHTLAASLSACIYQSLCDSHSYSSPSETNQFTGMVYQGLLLSDRRRLRTESIEEHATPTSAPAQWPGVSSLISLLACAQGDDQIRLNVMLCEAVVAVYLSLLIHGLGTHSGNELFRLAAHPLNNRMWAAVFGGGAKLIVKPKRPPEITPGKSSDVDRQRRRFNMRMLVPGRPVKETPATPPPIPVERPTYKEKFIPPELSMWDYFVAKPFLPLSDSGALYDSDESGGSDNEDDDDDDDAFLSDTQMTEHSNPNSYSWSLIRLVMVKLSLHNVKTFLPLTGLDFTELPVTTPLTNAVLKTLENWEQILLEKMNKFDSPPPNYINTYPTDLSAGGGPAILRHKAMLEPDNTPFKSKHHLSFPARRLWHFLVKQEVLQETLIRYIFTKKRKQSEVTTEHSGVYLCTRVVLQVEADMGYPGGKAKIIHKESDIIMAFAINKANTNEIVLASTHDVQEVDVSSLLAAQPYTWIGEEFDKESRSSDDVDYRSSHTNIAQTSAGPFAPQQMAASSSMPWLGSGQTSMGASVIMKRNLNNVKRMTSHPIYQYYMTGAQDGSVRMFEWNRPQQLICFRQAGNARVTRLYFNSQGNKCGVADGEGFLSLWQVNQTSSNPKPYLSWQCHSKSCCDFAFITSSSLIATAGQSNDGRNVCLWDTLISPSNSMIHAFQCHENGATVLQYAPKQQLIITGGRKGFVCIFDIRQRQLLHTFQAHDSAIKAMAMDSTEDFFVTGSAEGNMKVWKLAGHGLMHSFSTEHAKQSIFRNIGAGVMKIETCPGNRIFTCGADGTLKMRVLPDRYNIPASIFQIL
uniref:DmX-like protein 2 n=1 Tax=Sinocyclocheilus grahami TaxID=75366 RepID=A0A672R5A9_SINGR